MKGALIVLCMAGANVALATYNIWCMWAWYRKRKDLDELEAVLQASLVVVEAAREHQFDLTLVAPPEDPRWKDMPRQ